MEKFWAAILIFVVVAAAGLMYVNQVYNPQKDSQTAMADTANQTLTAVRAEMDNGSSASVVTAESVKQTVRTYCEIAGNTIKIIVTVGGKQQEYLSGVSDIDTFIGSSSKSFLKKTERVNGVLKSITFSEI